LIAAKRDWITRAKRNVPLSSDPSTFQVPIAEKLNARSFQYNQQADKQQQCNPIVQPNKLKNLQHQSTLCLVGAYQYVAKTKDFWHQSDGKKQPVRLLISVEIGRIR
jgi:hypothetical protein